jgi:hypothetical protein
VPGVPLDVRRRRHDPTLDRAPATGQGPKSAEVVTSAAGPPHRQGAPDPPKPRGAAAQGRAHRQGGHERWAGPRARPKPQGPPPR